MKSVDQDINSPLAQAQKELLAENSKRAVSALKTKLKALGTAKTIVKNILAEIEDLNQAIADGNF